MTRKILLGIVVLLAIGLLFVFIWTRPSGDIDKYKEYFTDDLAPADTTHVKVSFFGVSTLLFDDGETQFLIDGFFSRFSLLTTLLSEIKSDTAGIDNIIAAHPMNRVKGIFVTHSHYDHAFDVAYTTKRTGATLYGSLSTLNIARGGAVKEEQLSLFHPNETVQLGKFRITIIGSRHSPGKPLKEGVMTIDEPLQQPAKMIDYAEGGAFDFLIEHEGKRIYVKPSPNYLEGALDSLRADVLFIGIATITKQTVEWQNAYYEQTVGKLKPTIVVPIHWDDFFHPISGDLVMLPKFASDNEKDFDFFISRTKADRIDFKILQGTKSILLFKE